MTASKPVSRKKPLAGRRDKDAARPVRCQICRAVTTPGLDVGPQPVGDLVLSRGQLNQPETFYPMQLHHCPKCGLTQLGYIVNPRIVYKNFPFVSGTTQTATRHLQTLPPQLVNMLGLDSRSFAVDIGSNDGTLLKAYIPFGVKFLGVDPSGDPVRIAREQGIPTMHAFFDDETVDTILSDQGQANAITACGVFGHIADLTGLMRAVKRLLAPGGVFATDSQYWLDTMARRHYDNMFHQHLRYYAMKPLIHLFKQHDMEVFDVERSEVYGGSIRVFAGHTGDNAISQRVTDLLEVENEARLYDDATNESFALDIGDRRKRLLDAVHSRVRAGKKVIGIGAPAKAATVCNYCRLGPELIDYITEVNPLRMGRYLPGVHIPIVDEERMFDDERPADAAVLFAWNYHDEIVPRLRQRGFKGEILLP
ncbi:MAG TPA: class I SAM-dependent methyltransferase [Gemmatimonadaceae bacterium]|nr:class I SAM-dependent methyltransferase [Gemmatimonadaceae bacterium]